MNPHSHTIACLGPEGSFSHEFAMAHFVGQAFHCVEGGFEEVLEQVENGSCSHAVIPFLNANGRDVRPAQIALGKNREWIHVDGCYAHLIRHNVVVTKKFQTLLTLYSKEQVFPQCSNWLSQWQDVKTISSTSTSAALRDLLDAPPQTQKTSGAICNSLAHELYGGRIEFAGIQNPLNFTFFLCISKRPVSLEQSELLICLTCTTKECYKATINEFAAAGFPLKFASLNGEFSKQMPCFLQFKNSGPQDKLAKLLSSPHRKLVGVHSSDESLGSRVSELFDEDY